MIKEVLRTTGEVFRLLPRFVLVLVVACVLIPLFVIHDWLRQCLPDDDRARLDDRGGFVLVLALVVAYLVAQVVIGLW